MHETRNKSKLFAVFAMALMLAVAFAAFVPTSDADSDSTLPWDGQNIAPLTSGSGGEEFYTYSVAFQFAGSNAQSVHYDLYKADGTLIESLDQFNFQHTFTDIGTYYIKQVVTNPNGTATQWYSCKICGYPVITFNCNGGSNVEPIQQTAYGVKATAPADPTKTGVVFDCWYTDAELKNKWSWDTQVTKSITLYAKWTGTHTVTLKLNGGSFDDSTPSTITVKDGYAATKPTSNPTKTGFTFSGWYTDAALTQQYDWSTKVNSDITLYAKYVDTTVYVVISFNSNGGSVVNEMSVAKDQAANKPANPTKDGYTFDGWYTNAELTSKYNWESKVTANMTLYAKWTEKSTSGTVVDDAKGIADKLVDFAKNHTILLILIILTVVSVIAFAITRYPIFLISAIGFGVLAALVYFGILKL